jgi:ribosome biogenesis GTPase
MQEIQTIMRGRVIQTTGSWYQVYLAEQNRTIACRLKGKLKIKDIDTTNPIAVGDYVLVENSDDKNDFVITEIEERRNYIIRQSPRQKHQRHIIASNIDQFFIIATISQPRTSIGFLDRCIAAAECYHIPVTIIINKKDILRDKDLQKLEDWKMIYKHISYPIHVISSFNDEDLLNIKNLLRNKTTLVAGHSGVGKTSLLNAINPNLKLKTGTISTKWEKGKHTTTFATLYQIETDTYIIDTPGIKEFSILHVEPEEVSGYFIDINHFAKDCKYNNCMHINEPDCKVVEALEQGKLAPSRYENYLNIIQNIEETNYWERK